MTITNYFDGCRTPQEIKTRYKALAMAHHPDRGGNTAIMQIINEQYHVNLKACDGINYGKHRYNYRPSYESAVMDMINKVINYPVNVEIIGSWIWLTGDTKPHRAEFKKLGFRFSAKKESWYWHNPADGYRKRNKKTFQMNEIRFMFGTTGNLEKDERQQIQA